VWEWLVPLVTGAILGLAFTPCARWLAVKTGDIDAPIRPKIHERATPRLGGVAICAAFTLATLLIVPLSTPVIGLLVGGIGAVAVGIVDEYRSLPPLVHLSGQVACAVLAIVAGVGIVKNISIPASLASPGFHVPAVFGFAFTLFWLVGMMNTINFLDGLDGLVAGVAGIAALLLAVWASNPQRFLLAGVHHEELLLPMILVGCIIGFLPFNWHVARIFLGDSGSMFLGLVLASLSIIGPAKLGTALLILLIPVLDVAWAIVRRQLRGRSFLGGDKQHVYHRMLELGLSHTQTVFLLYALCLALAGLDLWLVKLYKLIAFVVLAALTAGAFVLLELRAESRVPSAAGEAATSPVSPSRR
jgi:UDP-GlcNAc:undecaprenyl-phosphate GlcNAc-1-phosphate transferase